MQIDAAVVHAVGAEFTIERVKLDSPQDDEVLVKIAAVGICHTDLSVRDGHLPMPSPPSVLGHEGAGVVVEVGKAVKDLKRGDHVVLSFASCGSCPACAANTPARCENYMAANLGGRRPDGSCTHRLAHHEKGGELNANFFGQSSFGSYALVKARHAVHVANDLPLEVLAPMGCAIITGAGAVFNVLKALPGSSFVVFGTGAVGLSALMAAKVAQCNPIIAVDMHETRLTLAKELGATHTINARNEKALQEILAISGGGADHVVEASGALPAIENALLSVRRFGSVVLLGAPKFGAKLTIDAYALLSGATIQTAVQGDCDPKVFIPVLIDLYKAGKLPLERLMKIYDFSEINEAVHDAETGAVIKPVIRMPA